MQQPIGIAIVKSLCSVNYADKIRKGFKVKMTTAPSLDAVQSMFKFVKVGRCYMILWYNDGRGPYFIKKLTAVYTPG
jgi:hypothetical protein